MFKIICVTNRSLCGGDLLAQLERVAASHPDSIILREKDMSAEEYAVLAQNAMKICEKYDVQCVLHSFYREAAQLGAHSIHLPLHILREMTDSEKRRFDFIGASCHSVEDVKNAEQIGASYITVGHIFATDCKKGLPGRGLDLLSECCHSTELPVYAIGGISAENIADVAAAGASGACIMSGFMRCDTPKEYIKALRGELNDKQK